MATDIVAEFFIHNLGLLDYVRAAPCILAYEKWAQPRSQPDSGGMVPSAPPLVEKPLLSETVISTLINFVTQLGSTMVTVSSDDLE